MLMSSKEAPLSDPPAATQLLLEGLAALPYGFFLLSSDLSLVWSNDWIASEIAETSWLDETLREVLGASESELQVTTLKDYERIVPYPEPESVARWFEISLSVLRDGAGSVLGVMGRIEDVSDRVRAEARLREEISRRRILVKQSPEAMVVLDDKGKVFEANQGFADMLGYSLAEVEKLAVWDWDARFEPTDLLAMLGKADESGHHLQTEHRRKDGSTIHVEMGTNGATFDDRKLIFCVCRAVADLSRPSDVDASSLQKPDPKGWTDIIPMCASCKMIRDGEGNWQGIEVYIAKRFELWVSHGICPDCVEEHYRRTL